jgi:cobalamin biosynthesis protein CobC
MPNEAMERAAHGGDLDAARRQFPSAPEPWIDLSTGINPVPYPLPQLPPEVWQRLPERTDIVRLAATAARAYGAGDGATIVAAPGTQALIGLLPRLRAHSKVAILGPTYAEHEIRWRREGHRVAVVPQIEAMAGADVVVIVNPNNPTGRFVERARLRQLAADLDCRGGLLVVDEAFADVMDPPASLVPELPPATLVLRSFGKTFGLAGLRLGFAITDPTLARRISDLLGPWAVSGPAIAIAERALADTAWLLATRRRLAEDAARLDALLRRAGCEVIGGTPLFRLAAHHSAQRLYETLGGHGIHVRRFAENATWLRFGLPGTEDSWLRLSQALGACPKVDLSR